MENIEQGNVMVNPNQVWFPHILQVLTAKVLGIDNTDQLYADIVSDTSPQVGTKVIDGWGRDVIIGEIYQKHKAIGNWKGAFWKGVKPTWYRVLASRVTPPTKKELVDSANRS